MDKIIVHIDLNTFFVQCEILQNPSLKGKAVAVGYDGRRGVISTSSYEARKKGVFSGMPVSTAKKTLPSLILVDCHFELYKKYSKIFFSYLKKKYPIIEMASIDECYIDMSKEAPRENLYEYLFDLQMELYRATELKCSIGVGWNKFLAKMGSDYKKPLGLTIFTRENYKELLYPLSIDKMFGIGKKTAPKLLALGIETIGDLAKNESVAVVNSLGNTYDYYQALLNGRGDDVVSTLAFDPKSISAERTFASDDSSEEELLSMVRTCCLETVNELLKYQKVCQAVGIKIRDSSFNTKSKRISLSSPTDDFDTILMNVNKVFHMLYKGQEVRLIGTFLERVIDKPSARKEKKDDVIKDLRENMEDKDKLIYLSDLMKEGDL